jgi:hypothetical protein
LQPRPQINSLHTRPFYYPPASARPTMQCGLDPFILRIRNRNKSIKKVAQQERLINYQYTCKLVEVGSKRSVICSLKISRKEHLQTYFNCSCDRASSSCPQKDQSNSVLRFPFFMQMLMLETCRCRSSV